MILRAFLGLLMLFAALPAVAAPCAQQTTVAAAGAHHGGTMQRGVPQHHGCAGAACVGCIPPLAGPPVVSRLVGAAPAHLPTAARTLVLRRTPPDLPPPRAST